MGQVGDEGSTAGGGRDAVEGAGQEAQAHGPALGAGLESGQVNRGEGQAQRFVQKGGRLVGGEAQVRGAQFGQLAARPQAGQCQGRVVARGYHQVHLRRQPFEQIVQRGVDGRLGDQVEVVQYQGKGVGKGFQDIVDQHADDAPRLRTGVGQVGQEGPSRGAAGRVQASQGSDEIRQKEGRIVVTFVQREPGQGENGGWRMENGGQEGGLAVAGWGGEEGEAVGGQAVAQRCQQARAREHVAAGQRGLEFGLDQPGE